MLGRESESKSPNGLSGKPGRGLVRDMSGVVVEDDFNGGVGRIGGVDSSQASPPSPNCGGSGRAYENGDALANQPVSSVARRASRWRGAR